MKQLIGRVFPLSAQRGKATLGRLLGAVGGPQSDGVAGVGTDDLAGGATRKGAHCLDP